VYTDLVIYSLLTPKRMNIDWCKGDFLHDYDQYSRGRITTTSSDHDYSHGPSPNRQETTLANTTSHHHEPADLERHQRHRASSAETILVPDYVHDGIIERQPADNGLNENDGASRMVGFKITERPG